MRHATALDRLADALATWPATKSMLQTGGTLTDVAPTVARIAGLGSRVALGDRIRVEGVQPPILGEIVRVGAQSVEASFYTPAPSLASGAIVLADGPASVAPHVSWRGRSIDAHGSPIDGRGPLMQGVPRPLDVEPLPALRRARITTPLRTGVSVVDVFTPLCLGQRIGVFAGSGVGKSTLLGMLARTPGFDTIVVALVGERGREVREFLEGPLASRREDVVAVVATADESAMTRRLAARTAMAVAEMFRDAGQSVLLVVDSITRHAQATREIGLAAGEPAVARGFPPSVFADLPRLLERAGPGIDGAGTITGVFAVLVDGDDHNDPIADAVRGTLDGHIVLDRTVADGGRFPAVDIPRSLSRLSHLAWSPQERQFATRLRAQVSLYEETRDLRSLAGHTPGLDPRLDEAVALVPRLYGALTQGPDAGGREDAFEGVRTALGLATI